MNINEYNQIKNYTYKEYCDYLLNKYGPAEVDYFDVNYVKIKEVTRTGEGLFCHHMKENEAPNLSDPDIARLFPFEYQEKHNLVYCNWLEHIFLHLLIAQENIESGLGINGANFMLREIEELYEGKEITLPWVQNCFNAIEEDFDVFEELLKKRDDRNVLLEHNTVVYSEMVEALERDNKTVVVIGTGGGKTTTALQYLRDFGIRGLVLAPTKIIVDGWKTNPEVDVITHAKFRNSYENIDYSKYGVVICDEAHHVTSETVTGRALKYVIDNKLSKVIGLTAEEKKSDGKKVADDMYGGNICQGITVLEGIKEGILHPFSYVGAIYNRDEIRDEFKDLEDLILKNQLDLALNNTPELKEILTSNMPSGPRKGIIFVSQINDIPETLNIMKDIYPNVEYRWIHSRQNEELNEANKKWFRDTEEGYLISINMISEGAHYRGVNTLIMFRRTESPLVFNQQLGRLVTLTKYENPNGIVFDLVNNSNNVAYGDGKVRIQLKEGLREYIEKNKGGKSDALIVRDYTEDVVEILERIKYKNIFKPVICINTKKRYSSLTEASLDTGAHISKISECCHGKRKTAGGLSWSFEKDYEENMIPYSAHSEKSVICLNTQEEYVSIMDASRKTGCDFKKISACCLGLQKTTKSLSWVFVENWTPDLKPNPAGIGAPKIAYSVTENIAYESATYASKILQCSSSLIQGACQKEIIALGEEWKYITEEEVEERKIPLIKENEDHPLKKSIQKKETQRGISVVCIETGISYASAAEAQRQTNISSSTIVQVCKGKNKTAGGYRWVYQKDYNSEKFKSEIVEITQKMFEIKNNNKRGEEKRGRGVKCIETQVVFNSAVEASNLTGISRTGIGKCCRGVQKTAGGFHWEYVD